MNIAILGEYGSHEFIRDSEIANAHRFIVVAPGGHSTHLQTEDGARRVAEMCGGKWYLAIEPEPERPIVLAALSVVQKGMIDHPQPELQVA